MDFIQAFPPGKHLRVECYADKRYFIVRKTDLQSVSATCYDPYMVTDPQKDYDVLAFDDWSYIKQGLEYVERWFKMIDEGQYDDIELRKEIVRLSNKLDKMLKDSIKKRMSVDPVGLDGLVEE